MTGTTDSQDKAALDELATLTSASRQRTKAQKDEAKGDTTVAFLDLLGDPNVTKEDYVSLGRLFTTLHDHRKAGVSVQQAIEAGNGSTPIDSSTTQPGTSALSNSPESAELQARVTALETLVREYEAEAQAFVTEHGGRNTGTNSGKYLLGVSLDSVVKAFEKDTEAKVNAAKNEFKPANMVSQEESNKAVADAENKIKSAVKEGLNEFDAIFDDDKQMESGTKYSSKKVLGVKTPGPKLDDKIVIDANTTGRKLGAARDKVATAIGEQPKTTAVPTAPAS